VRERLPAVAAGALCAYLAAYPLAAVFDRAFGTEAANGPLFALYLVGLALAFTLGALVQQRAPAGRRIRRALWLGAITTLLGGLVIALIATPADRDSGASAYATQVAGLAATPRCPWWCAGRGGGSARRRVGSSA
jgi:biotin transporter BioY